jgi:hypothetical protein
MMSRARGPPGSGEAIREARYRATLERLRSPQASLATKETAIGPGTAGRVQADQLLSFWEEARGDVYQCKLMLVRLKPANRSMLTPSYG